MEHNIYIYIAVMALVTYAIRVLPLTLIRKEIKNPFIRSFLYYVPYTTLAVMTFPAILQETQTPAAGALALGVGVATAWRGMSLFHVACCCCGVYSRIYHGAVRHTKSRRLRRFFSGPAAFLITVINVRFLCALQQKSLRTYLNMHEDQKIIIKFLPHSSQWNMPK